MSVSRRTHDLREFGGPVLEPGFILKGKMSVMGIETTGAISLLPREVCLTANLYFYLALLSPVGAKPGNGLLVSDIKNSRGISNEG